MPGGISPANPSTRQKIPPPGVCQNAGRQLPIFLSPFFPSRHLWRDLSALRSRKPLVFPTKNALSIDLPHPVPGKAENRPLLLIGRGEPGDRSVIPDSNPRTCNRDGSIEAACPSGRPAEKSKKLVRIPDKQSPGAFYVVGNGRGKTKSEEMEDDNETDRQGSDGGVDGGGLRGGSMLAGPKKWAEKRGR